jgi:SAM-dependent methyltransferase
MSAGNPRLGRVAISFVVDSDPVFAYTGWHLAHSLAEHVRLPWCDIHVQFTPEAPADTVRQFRELGCSTHRLSRFGDGKYCNKLAQWENLRSAAADHYVFLDTDMICVEDFTRFLPPQVISGKVVDVDNPKLELIDHLFDRAGFLDRPPIVPVEARAGSTFRGNCNGGLYSVPATLAEGLFEAWRAQALTLLDDIDPLRTAGKGSHVDQISFCMAVHGQSLPFEQLPSNANYYVHFPGPHPLRDPARPIALLHYHDRSLNVVGLLDPAGAVHADEIAAVEQANDQIRGHFHGRRFWELRYRCFPDRGSGVGSRGRNLEYKRALLRGEGAERAASVLDVGCGDLEVMRGLELSGYTGIDTSPVALAIAAEARPDWTFIQAPAPEVTPAELVICFEVAIHQETESDYRRLIAYLAERTERTLIVSGYDEANPAIAANHMLFFHEPLRRSLADTGRFSSIRRIGAHSDVVIYRCDM